MLLKSTGCSAGGVQASPRGLVRLNVHRAAARTPLIAACLHDWPVQAAIPGKGAKRLFFSDGHGVKAFVELQRAFCRAGVRAHSNEVTACLQAQPEQAALSGGGVGDGAAAKLIAFMCSNLKSLNRP